MHMIKLKVPGGLNLVELVAFLVGDVGSISHDVMEALLARARQRNLRNVDVYGNFIVNMGLTGYVEFFCSLGPFAQTPWIIPNQLPVGRY